MKKITLWLAAVLGSAVTLWAGPIVIDGTDANNHGSSTGSTNIDGWAYMQKVLENIAGQLDSNVVKVVVDLGTDDTGGTSTTARAAIDSAFSLSSLPADGWVITHVNGAAEIDTWLANLSRANTGILYIPTVGNADGDLAVDELTVVNDRSAEIADFVSGGSNPLQGGGLFAMGESPSISGAIAYGWLIELLPDATVVDAGAGGVGTSITLTPEGESAFPGLSSADLSAGPWHNYFDGDFGNLEILANAPDNGGTTQTLIIGGGARASFFSLHDQCITRNTRYWFTHPDSVMGTNCASLINMFHAMGGGMSLGFLRMPSGFRNNDNVRNAEDSVIEALGLYWRDRVHTGEIAGTQSERLLASRLCRARKRLGLELIAATANVRFLGTNPTNCFVSPGVKFPSDLLSRARRVAAGINLEETRAMTPLLRKFNNAGLTNDFFGGLVECSAGNARTLRARGRDPTTQANCPGVNDSCDNAEALYKIPFSQSVDLAQFTDDIDNPSCGIGGADAVWKIAPPFGAVGRHFTVDTLGTTFSTLLSIWKGSCSNLSAVACNPGTNFFNSSKLDFRTDGTNTYFIVLEGLNGVVGSTKLHVTSP